ncbi:hypothetical protein B0H14DRAFT_2651934 [Mycena olivaceomarginata]|nr:hypothetical protein B0H14DRAFT_2651934 [Mycena olivaceomarginata]
MTPRALIWFQIVCLIQREADRFTAYCTDLYGSNVTHKVQGGRGRGRGQGILKPPKPLAYLGRYSDLVRDTMKGLVGQAPSDMRCPGSRKGPKKRSARDAIGIFQEIHVDGHEKLVVIRRKQLLLFTQHQTLKRQPAPNTTSLTLGQQPSVSDSVAAPSLSPSSLMSFFSNASGVIIQGGNFYSAGGDVNIQNNQQLVIGASEIQALNQGSTRNRLVGWEEASSSGPIRGNRTRTGEKFVPYASRPPRGGHE